MAPLTAYLFPGQGSQYVGMGRALCDRSPSARQVFAQADSILGVALSDLCFNGPASELNDTINTQPAILATSVAALRALAEGWDESPSFVAGHSMGEFSALVAAGALSLEDALRLVRERGRLMKQAGERQPGGMAALIGLDRDTVEAICETAHRQSGQYVGIANDNCPGQLVISGAVTALALATELAREKGAKRVIRLAVSIAAHSPLMEESADLFRQELNTAPFRPPDCSFVANATARPVIEPDSIREALGRQLTSPVLWTQSIGWMIEKGMTRAVEVGPGSVLAGLVRRIDRGVERTNVEEMLAS